MNPMLRVTDAVVTVGSARLLDGVSFEAPAGRIVAIVGPNGAGKTTLLDAISGVAPNLSGDVVIEGTAGGNGSNGSTGPLREGIGRVFQGSPLPETLTVAEVAALVTRDREEALAMLDRFGLAPHASSFVSELSTGMRRILDLALATNGRPSVLLLDEPASGLAQSEIEHLAELLRRWRDATSSAVIIVEHDAWLVKHLADEVIFMDGGRIVAQGPPGTVLRAPARAPRIESARDDRFREALARVAADAAPAAQLQKRTLSKWTLMRLGLRELSAGMGSVLILGVLSRVLKVELGVSLGVVTAILASYNLAAPVAVAIGHRSDHRPIFGLRRTPYIVAGAVVTGLAVAASPHVAGRLAGGVTVADVVFSVLLFVGLGLGMYSSGTVFFALLADRSGPSDRGHAASVVYLELMIGVLFGVVLTGAILKEDARNVGTLFGIAGLLVVVLTVIAVWGQEKRSPAAASPAPSRAAAPERPTLRTSIRAIAAIPQARLFFVFMVLSTLFLFLQQAVLTSFGGDVLHMSVRATSGFSAMLTIGTIAGMTVAGRPYAEQVGHRRVAIAGLGGSVFAFAGLAAAAATSAGPPAWLSILGLGFTSGMITVSSLALMMAMADRRRMALFMGLWTFAHAIADGAATAGGGSVFEVFRRLFGSIPGGYASVFAIEALGLAVCIPLLRAVDPNRFASQSAGLAAGELAEAAAVAAIEPAALELAAAEIPPAPKPAPGRPSAPRTARRATKNGAGRARPAAKAKPKPKPKPKAKANAKGSR